MRNNELSKILNKTIANRIRAFREAKKISREQLAFDIGVSPQQLQKYEKGIDRISAPRLCLLSKALNESIDIICGIEKKGIPPSQLVMFDELFDAFIKLGDVRKQAALLTIAKTLN